MWKGEEARVGLFRFINTMKKALGLSKGKKKELDLKVWNVQFGGKLAS